MDLIKFGKGIKHNKFLKNTNWMIFEKVFEMFITLFVGIIVTRYLGPKNYGIINYSLSFIAIFTFVANLGLDSIVISYLVKEEHNKEEIIGTSIFMRIIGSLISIILILVCVNIIQPNDKILSLVCLIQSFSLFFKSFEIIEIWFQSTLNSKKVVIIKTVASIIIGIYKITLIFCGANLIWFAFSILFQNLIISILLIILYFNNNNDNNNMKINISLGKELLGKSYHFIISGMIMVIYTQMDKIMVGKYINEINVGYYSAAITLSQLWFFIPYAVINSSRPIILNLKDQNQEKYENSLLKLFSFIILSGIVVSLFISIFSENIIFILYGEMYILAKNALVINVWAGIFALLGVARDIWYVAEKKMTYSKIFIIIGSIMNIILNNILIPKIGIDGAAIATLITQASVCLIAPLFWKNTQEISLKMIKSLNLKLVWGKKIE